MENRELEQYKLAIETADKTTDRRYNFNKFMILIMTALIAALATITTNHFYFIGIPIALIGIFICLAWYKQINCFKEMVRIKYKSIKDMENNYSKIIKVYNNEYNEREKARKRGFKSFSEQEKMIANIFKWGFIVYLFLIIIKLFIDYIFPILLFYKFVII